MSDEPDVIASEEAVFGRWLAGARALVHELEASRHRLQQSVEASCRHTCDERCGAPFRFSPRYDHDPTRSEALHQELSAEREMLSDCGACGAPALRRANSPTLYEFDRVRVHECAPVHRPAKPAPRALAEPAHGPNWHTVDGT